MGRGNLSSLDISKLQQRWRHLKREIEEVEKQLVKIRKRETLSAKEEYNRKFPGTHLHQDLVGLVGILPPTSINEDKKELIEIVGNK